LNVGCSQARTLATLCCGFAAHLGDEDAYD
jgi:hypothetical protein